MKIEFIDNIPKNYAASPILISGEASHNFSGSQFIALMTDEEDLKIYEIKYEVSCSPFNHLTVLNDKLAVGFEEYFYVFDVKNNRPLRTLKLDGYFGHIYVDNEMMYIADASFIYCLADDGSIKWRSNALSIDGVIIHTFGATKIYGSGEWDPPGGWIDFVIDKKTGEHLDE